MKVMKILFLSLFFSLPTGCCLFGEHFPQYEIVNTFKKDSQLCLEINNPDDYFVHYISIRDRNSPERSDFNRILPALKISDGQLCISEKYYNFPISGEKNIDIALRSPTKKMNRRFIMSEFTLINGVPFPFHPRDYSVPIPDAEDYQ